MPNLYVDVDGTLVQWKNVFNDPLLAPCAEQGPHICPMEEAWAFDEGVIGAIARFQKQCLGRVILWSGGGRDYAAMWNNRLEQAHGVKADAALAKFAMIPIPGDVFIDDSPDEFWKKQSVLPEAAPTLFVKEKALAE